MMCHVDHQSSPWQCYFPPALWPHGGLAASAKAAESCCMERLLLAKSIKPPVGASKRCAGRA